MRPMEDESRLKNIEQRAVLRLRLADLHAQLAKISVHASGRYVAVSNAIFRINQEIADLEILIGAQGGDNARQA